MPPVPARRPRYGEAREALVAATVRVVAAQGVRGLTYRSVAAEAGVTHGSVQHHFGTVDALLEAALVDCVELSINLSALAEGSDDVEEFVRDLAAGIRASADAQAFQYEVLLEARRRPELRPHVDRYYAAYRSAMTVALRRMGLRHDVGAVDLVFSALDGLVFRAIVLGEEGFRAMEPALVRLRETLRALRADVPG